jgi:hypothetical protein
MVAYKWILKKYIFTWSAFYISNTKIVHGPEPKSAKKNEKEVKVGKDFDIDKLKHYSRFFSAMFLSLSPFSPWK